MSAESHLEVMVRPIGALGYLRTFLFSLEKCGAPQTPGKQRSRDLRWVGASGTGVDPEAGRGQQ